jgi:type 1 fimbriae regulatory protein FimE
MKNSNHIDKTTILDILRLARAASERDFCMILIAYRHGMRASEVCELRTNHVADGYLTIKRNKGSRKTIQPLFPSADPLLDERTAITQWLRSSSAYEGRPVPIGARLFPITRQTFTLLFKRYALAAGVPSHLAHVHSAKHAIAYELVDKIGLHELQQFLGHQSLNSTGRYLKTTDDEVCEKVGLLDL